MDGGGVERNHRKWGGWGGGRAKSQEVGWMGGGG